MKTHLKASDVTDRLLRECIHPNANELSATMLSGQLACIVFEPNAENEVVARTLGWDGIGPVFSMNDRLRTALARAIEQTDPICAGWLRENPVDHLFVLIKHGLILVNFDRRTNTFRLVEPPDETTTN